MKFKVVFEEMNLKREWVQDYFSNNGKGFSYNDALYIANDLKSHGCDGIPIRNVKIEEL